jgi:hypothetical protein
VIVPFSRDARRAMTVATAPQSNVRVADGHDPFKVIVDKRPGGWQAQVDVDS